MAVRVSNQPIFDCIWGLSRRNQCLAHALVGNLLLWFSWIDKLSNCLLNIYVYAHTLVLFSTLAREASFYSGPKLMPAEDKQLWSPTFCRDQGTWQKKGWKECKSWRGRCCERCLPDMACLSDTHSQTHSWGLPAQEQDRRHCSMAWGGIMRPHP